jgi:multifunctional methyltransferase subunit TRM112
MRLITHNMLQCHAKGCDTNNFPLRFEEVEVDTKETDFNEDFLKNFIVKLDWPALYETALTVNIDSGFGMSSSQGVS